MGELHAVGVRIFTDDGACVMNASVMRRALEYARSLPGSVIAQHAEDENLAGDGSMHEGAWSSRLGIPGRPSAAETVIVARDIELCALTGTRMHFLHVSAAETVDLVRVAKARGLPVTCEAAPHHFTLTDAECAASTPCSRCTRRCAPTATSPPSGQASPTAPSTPSPPTTRPTPRRARSACSKKRPRGCSASRPRSRSTLTELVEPGHLNLRTALGALSWRPAEIAGMRDQGGVLEAGRVANVAVIDPAVKWEVDPLRLASRARNTPYIGRKLTGKVRHTIFRGSPVVIDAEATR